MKKILIVIVSSLLFLVSCEKGKESIEAQSSSSAEKMIFVCSSPSEGSKKISVDTNTGSVLWEQSDKIFVVNSYGDGAEFSLLNGAGTSNATFEGELVPSEKPNGKYYGFYPTSSIESYNNFIVNFSVPSEQHYVEGGVQQNIIPFIAKSKKQGSLEFSSAFGLFRLGLKGSDVISKIVLTDQNGKFLSGKYSVDLRSETPSVTYSSNGSSELTLICDTPIELSDKEETYFTFSVPTGVFNNGFLAKIYDTTGKIATVVTSRDNTIKASEMIYINNITCNCLEIVDLDDTSMDNETMLKSLLGKRVNVRLKNRFISSKYHNTLCLPFSLNPTYASFYFPGTKFARVTGLSHNSKTSHTISFNSSCDSISAGVPCALKPSKDLQDPLFYDVVIECSSPTIFPVGTGYISGTFQQTWIKKGYQNIFLIANDMLTWAGQSNYMRGFRFYCVCQNEH